MEVVEIKGNVFDALSPGDSFAHGANCKGVMGAGIAATVKKMWPNNYYRYRLDCKEGRFVPGGGSYYHEKGINIYNLATQDLPGANAQASLITHSLTAMGHHLMLSGNETTVKTVQVGCGIGGMKWKDVKWIMESIDLPITLEVYYL